MVGEPDLFNHVYEFGLYKFGNKYVICDLKEEGEVVDTSTIRLRLKYKNSLFARNKKIKLLAKGFHTVRDIILTEDKMKKT